MQKPIIEFHLRVRVHVFIIFIYFESKFYSICAFNRNIVSNLTYIRHFHNQVNLVFEIEKIIIFNHTEKNICLKITLNYR